MAAGSSTDLASELIQVVQQRPTGLERWEPSVGPETLDFLHSLRMPDDAKRRIAVEALAVLSKCVPPHERCSPETGIVIGHIQSGKTLSFTAIAALARDNGYRLLIVITGTSTSLFAQSTGRLRKDLRLDERPDFAWQQFENPRLVQARQSLNDRLREWRNPALDAADQQTVLITVMKERSHLENVIRLLSQLDLQDVPAIVIDDEADQAGLNTRVRRDDQSPTYLRLVRLRQCLPHHTLLQYTATPQAPLLLNVTDILSPRFHELLMPGADYTGGGDLLSPGSRLAITIPDPEIPSRTSVLDRPPPSLLFAMRVYFLGVAAGLLTRTDEEEKHRSMLVHPSRQVAGHAQYYNWVTSIIRQWSRWAELAHDETDYKHFVADFRVAYDELARTVDGLPPFGILMDKLPLALGRVTVWEMNAAQQRRTPEIDWTNSYGHVLVGGQALDRGYTVEGLTVTYMPRGLGVGNADTLQQRARFLGYKRRYLGYCRVFLEGHVRAAYESYVEHEENMRSQLERLRDAGKSLADWRRAFLLSRALRPTRHNVLALDYMRGDYCDTWFEVGAPHESEEAVHHNRRVVGAFLRGLRLEDDEGHPERTPIQRHKVAVGVSLERAFAKLLVEFRVANASEVPGYTGLLLQVRAYLDDNPDAECAVFEMSGGRTRERSVDKHGVVRNLYQGADYNKDGDETYPGDRKVRVVGSLTIQLHSLRILRDPKSREVLHEDVLTLAVWVPREMSAAWISQEELRRRTRP